MRLALALVSVLLAAPALAQSADVSGPSQEELDVVVRRGSLATLTQLCRIRDGAWAEDLRKAAIQDATRAPTPDDDALRDAPGSDLASSALGFADSEALEDFAAAPPAATCGKLSHDPDLIDADRRVATYRQDLARAKHLW